MHLLARPSYLANTYHACNLNISNPTLITNVKILGGTIGFQGPLVQAMATSNTMQGPSNPT
jgi:hypothetical protein